MSSWMQVWVYGGRCECMEAGVSGYTHVCLCMCVCVLQCSKSKQGSFIYTPLIQSFQRFTTLLWSHNVFSPLILLSNALLSSYTCFPASAKVMSMWLLLLFNSSFQTVWPLSGARLSGGCQAFSFSPEKIQLTFGSHEQAVWLTLANKKMTLCSPTDWGGLGMRLSQ